MTYEHTLETEKVKEHPMEGFKEMANISTGGNFGDQFAQLINELTTNVIIPVDDEDALKEWAAKHAQGERVYAEINGDMKIVDVPADSVVAADVDVRNIGGSGDGVPNRAQYFSEGEISGVEDFDQRAEFILRSSKGRETSATWEEWDEDLLDSVITVRDGGLRNWSSVTEPAGLGMSVRVSIDCSEYDTLKAKFYTGESGYIDRLSASEFWDISEYNNDPTHVIDFGGGGIGVAIVDGDDNIVVGVSGGAGGTGGGALFSTSTNLYGEFPTDYFTDFSHRPRNVVGGSPSGVPGGTESSYEERTPGVYDDHYLDTDSGNNGDVEKFTSYVQIEETEFVDDDRQPIVESFVGV